jgi:hypothetical protein
MPTEYVVPQWEKHCKACGRLFVSKYRRVGENCDRPDCITKREHERHIRARGRRRAELTGKIMAVLEAARPRFLTVTEINTGLGQPCWTRGQSNYTRDALTALLEEGKVVRKRESLRIVVDGQPHQQKTWTWSAKP